MTISLILVASVSNNFYFGKARSMVKWPILGCLHFFTYTCEHSDIVLVLSNSDMDEGRPLVAYSNGRIYATFQYIIMLIVTFTGFV